MAELWRGTQSVVFFCTFPIRKGTAKIVHWVIIFATSACRAQGEEKKMPQGGPGNCGGNLNGSGGSKKKMSSKKQNHKVWHSESKKGQKPYPLLGEPRCYNVHAPEPEQRAAVLRAHQELDARRLLASTRPVEGTVSGGEMLGGSTDSSCDAREARLRYFQVQQKELHDATRRSNTLKPAKGHVYSEEQALEAARRAVSELPLVKTVRTRAAASDCNAVTSDASGSEECVGTIRHLLDRVAERVGSTQSMGRIHKVMSKVLTNAGSKGKDDAKYLRLKSSNDALWNALLQHPECVAVLELGGFAVVTAEPVAGAEDAGRAEIARLQIALQEELEGTGQLPNPVTVEALMQRLEDLAVAAAPAPAQTSNLEAHQGCGRGFDLLHPGVEAAAELFLAAQAVIGWEYVPADGVASSSGDGQGFRTYA